jgi:peptidyl-prolyl cis-trans isomerase A (cyclophilin A)
MPSVIRRRTFLLGAAAETITATPKTILFITPLGDIKITLSPKAPLSSNDFLTYVTNGFWNGGTFFRTVRPDNDHGHPQISVLQAAIANPDNAWSPIPHEPTNQTGLRHLDGTVSLTRAAPGTGSGAEIFICIGEQPALDHGGHRNPDGQGFAAFAQVTAGMEVVRQIWRLPATAPSPDAYTAGQILTDPVTITTA